MTKYPFFGHRSVEISNQVKWSRTPLENVLYFRENPLTYPKVYNCILMMVDQTMAIQTLKAVLSLKQNRVVLALDICILIGQYLT